MIIGFGGVKGGVGKTTLAVNMAVMRALEGRDILLVDADDQATASDFTAIRNETLETGAGYTAIKLHGSAVRSEVMRMVDKYDDIVIDVGGRDTAGQRAAMSIAQRLLVPFLPGSFDVWTLETVAELVEEAKAFNDHLTVYTVLNRADHAGQDNEEAASIALEIKGLQHLDTPLGNRKVFRNAGGMGLGVVEYRPKDKKAIAEISALYSALFA